MSRKPLDLSRYSKGGNTPRPTALDALIAAAPAEVEERARELGLPLKHLPTEQIAPDLQQLRRLPHPDDLVAMADDGDRAAQALVTELRALGESMREHGQLQPIIVYPDSDDARFPAMTHRIVMGQRRWSAAALEGLPTMWVVEVERPSPVFRILRQFDENEQREGLSDMERGWALQALKAALEDEAGEPVTWGMVEQRMQLSTQRRQDLLRLMRFTSEGQAIIARYRWPETAMRPLHMAISANTIDQDTANTILHELAGLEQVQSGTVQQYVDQYQPPPPSTNWFAGDDDGASASGARSADRSTATPLAGMARQIAKYRKGIEKLASQVTPDMDAGVRQRTLQEIEELMNSLEMLLQQLRDVPRG
jgi:hypothetical protein